MADYLRIRLAALFLAATPLVAGSPAIALSLQATSMLDVYTLGPTEVRVRFDSEVGPYFARTVQVVLGMKGVEEADEPDTWRYQIGDRGAQEDYALAFSSMPFVQEVQPVPEPGYGTGHNYVEGELLVKFKAGVKRDQIEAFNAEHGVKILDQIKGIDVYRLKLAANQSVEQMQKVFEESGLVQYAEPNHKVSVPIMPGMRPRAPKLAPHASASIEVMFQPGALPDLVNLVYGTHYIGAPHGNLVHLAPSVHATPEIMARVLKLCPLVQSVRLSS